MSRRLAVCIATYRRPEMLRRLLDSMSSMRRPEGVELEFRIVDNDAERSGQPVVDRFREQVEERVQYQVEPEQNIALARNRSLDMGPAHLIAFVDDDEVVPAHWVLELVAAIDRTGGDAVTSPVEGRLPEGAPAWAARGGFFDKWPGREDEPIDWRNLRTSNTLVDGRWFYEEGFRLDAGFGRSGSSDTDLFLRMEVAGARYFAAPAAGVWEDVEPERAGIRWLCKRHYRNGLTYHRLLNRLPRRTHPLTQFAARSLRCSLTMLRGMPGLVRGRPETCLRALFGAFLAWGGLVGWLRPGRARGYVEYGTRKPVEALCSDPSSAACADETGERELSTR